MYYRISKRDIRWLDQALKVAKESGMRQKHGAIIVKGGRVIAVYPNKMRNHPGIPMTDPEADRSCHAERGALKMVADARGATMYIARQGARGQALSKPCEACEKAMREAGIKRAVWTEHEGGYDAEVY